MNLKEKLVGEFEKVKDMESRGLLQRFYIGAWEDVMKIVEKQRDEENINILAHKKGCIVRFWSQNGIDWEASISPKKKGVNATMIKHHTYSACEHRAREILNMLDDKPTLG